MTPELIPATQDQAPILENLLELYIHDFSEFFDVKIGDDGKFGYPPLPLYWTDPDRFPFLVRIDGRLAGLVFVKKTAVVWDMAEFFVIRGCRKRGIGNQVARQVWKLFPGRWEVRVMEANVPARRFWAGAVAEFTGEAVTPALLEIGGVNWAVFSFESRR